MFIIIINDILIIKCVFCLLLLLFSEKLNCVPKILEKL